jgi:hypothetical protein
VKTGVQGFDYPLKELDSGFRRDDGIQVLQAIYDLSKIVPPKIALSPTAYFG